ncbi:MAG: hypothetical protein MI745_03170 [Pseudomonadales bacterium]|nr:hypothetical protein [Pseudomonadales bacterium]
MQRHLALLATVMVLAIVIFMGLKRIPVPPLSGHDSKRADTIVDAPPAAAPVAAHREAPETTEQPPVADTLQQTSLAGTTPPATLTLDANGNLIADSNSKAVMDYFLSLQGEITTPRIRTLLAQWATETAGDIAANDLLALFDRYHSYRERFASGEFAARHAGSVEARLQQRQQLRDDIFGADIAAALFAAEDRYDRFSLQRQSILDSHLSDAEKAQALSNLRRSLPENLARQYEQQYRLRHLQEATQSIRENGGDSDDLFAYHQQQFGDAAALRLQALEAQRQQWQQRYDDYVQQKSTILNSGLAPADQQQQLEQLRATLFDDAEQRRVMALDRLAQEKASSR